MKIDSERRFLQYLFSDYGVSFGVDKKDRSYPFLESRAGIALERRPVGDKVVETLDYEIPEIVRTRAGEPGSPKWGG
ncbi:MAG: hypothetical protein WBF81_00030 [Thermoplasmata archaeon]